MFTLLLGFAKFLLEHVGILSAVFGGGGGVLFVALRLVGGAASAVKYWKVFLIAAVGVLLLVCVGGLWWRYREVHTQLLAAQQRLDKLTGQYTTVLAQNQTLSSSNFNLAAKIALQSAANTLVAQESQSALGAMSIALATLQSSQKSNVDEITKLRARAADPKNADRSCEDEISAIRAGL